MRAAVINKSRWILFATNSHLTECTNQVGNCGGYHAEIKIILGLLNRGYQRGDRLHLVLDYSPCTNCANAIVDSGLFSRIIYGNVTTHDRRGIHILLNHGIACSHLQSWEDIVA